MSRYGDFQDALGNRVTYGGQPSVIQRDAVARLLAGTNIPVEHAASLRAIHTGADIPHPGIYRTGERSLLMRGNPDAMSAISERQRVANRRVLGHEIGHHASLLMNPHQFESAVVTPQGRGTLEAHAENYADQGVPGSYSAYDHLVNTGRGDFHHGAYRDARGPRFGNVDPRLTQFPGL